MKPKESVEQTSIRRISKVSCIPGDEVLTLRNFRKETNSYDSAGVSPLILGSLWILTREKSSQRSLWSLANEAD